MTGALLVFSADGGLDPRTCVELEPLRDPCDPRGNRPGRDARAHAVARPSLRPAVSTLPAAAFISFATPSIFRRAISLGQEHPAASRSRPCSRSNSPRRPGPSCLQYRVLGERMTASRDRRGRARPGRRAGHPAARDGDLPAGRAAGAGGGAWAMPVTMITTKKLTHDRQHFAIIFWMNVDPVPAHACSGSDPLFVPRSTADQIPALVAVGVTGLALALLPDQCVPGGRCERRRAARLPAHPADRGGRLVALRRTARRLRLHRRRPDHRRHPWNLRSEAIRAAALIRRSLTPCRRRPQNSAVRPAISRAAACPHFGHHSGA